MQVATHAAVELLADKLLCLTGEDVRALGLPQYLPLDDAEGMIQAAALQGGSARQGCALSLLEVPDGRYLAGSGGNVADVHGADGLDLLAPAGGMGSGADGGNGTSTASPALSNLELTLDLNSWQLIGFPHALLAAVTACRHGVTRGHLVDSTTDGALLLELYTRDGTEGMCMIAGAARPKPCQRAVMPPPQRHWLVLQHAPPPKHTHAHAHAQAHARTGHPAAGDVYEGIRLAEPRDQAEVAALLALLVSTTGVGLPFPPDTAEVGGCMESEGVYVVEREGKVLGCCVVEDHSVTSSGSAAASDRKHVAEVAALCIHPGFRRQGLGDSLLDFVSCAVLRPA